MTETDDVAKTCGSRAPGWDLKLGSGQSAPRRPEGGNHDWLEH